MISVRVFVKNISAENFWDIGQPLPPFQIVTNLNVVGVTKKDEDILEVPFVFTINYTPGIAQISLRGKSHVRGSKDELQQILEDQKEKKPPSPIIIQSISNVVFLESVIICRTLKIPPPIPLPRISPATKKKRSEPTYRA